MGNIQSLQQLQSFCLSIYYYNTLFNITISSIQLNHNYIELIAL